MSDRMTSIHLPGLPGGSGFADWGRKTVPEMIKILREYAAYNKANCDAILAAKDEDFKVETYVGVHVKKNREILQEGREA